MASIGLFSGNTPPQLREEVLKQSGVGINGGIADIVLPLTAQELAGKKEGEELKTVEDVITEEVEKLSKEEYHQKFDNLGKDVPKSPAEMAEREAQGREDRKAQLESLESRPVGAEAAKLDALNQISEMYASAIRRIGNGEDIKGIDVDAAKGIRSTMFGGEDGKQYVSKVPVEDWGVFFAVRTGRIEPTPETLPFIIQSMVSVASNGNVRGDFEGKRFMQFQSRVDRESHTVKSGLTGNTTDTTAANRHWEPKAVFDALQRHFDVQEETMAERQMMFNKKLLEKSCGLKEGENYAELEHDRQYEIANNLSGMFDRTWLTTRVDAALKFWGDMKGEGEYEDIGKIQNGEVIFNRLMSGDGFSPRVKKYVDGFKSACESGEYYRSPSEFARYLYTNQYEHTDTQHALALAYSPEIAMFPSMAKPRTYRDRMIGGEPLTGGGMEQESLRAVRNDNGEYVLTVRRGGRLDREVAFKNAVVGAYADMDGRYAAAEAIQVLNANPEAWTIVNRALDKQGASVMTNGMDARGLYQDLLSFYDKENTPQWHQKSRGVANAVVQALGAVDTDVGFYGENKVTMGLSGVGNIFLGVGKNFTEYFRDDFDDLAAEFASRHTPADRAEAEAYGEAMRGAVYNLVTKRIFDDNTIIGGAGQFWADIYALGKTFEVGGMALGEAVNLTGKGVYAMSAGTKMGTAARRIGIYSQRFGRAMVGVKNMRLVNELNDFNKTVREVRKMKDLSIVEKSAKISEMHDAFLQKVALKYGHGQEGLVEINKFIDGLARFMGKMPALCGIYNESTDRAYAEMLMNTTTLDDNEFTAEEKSALENYARGKGAVTTLMMAGLTHLLPKGFKKIMGQAQGELGMEADALDRLFLSFCKGQKGLSTLTPENEFLFRACVSSAMSRASLEAAKNGAFMFSMAEAENIIDNNRVLWEKMRLDPSYKPTAYDYLRGTGDALWEGGKAAAIAGVPMAVVGGVGGVRRARKMMAGIRNTRYGLAEGELRGEGDANMTKPEAGDVIARALLGLEDARSRGDKKGVDAIYDNIRRAGGARAAQFMRQLEHAVRRQAGERNIDIKTSLELLKGQEFTSDALKETLGKVGFRGAKVNEIGDGRMLITLDPADYGDVHQKSLKIVVSNSAVPVKDSSGAWSKSFVDTVVKDIEGGKVVGAAKRIWDSFTPAQKRRATGYVDDNGVTVAPRNVNGIWTEAQKEVDTKGIFLTPEAAKRFGSFSGEDVNLYDGLIVLSKGIEGFDRRLGEVNKALGSLDAIRKMAAKAQKNGGASVETFMHEFFHAVTELLPLDSNTRKALEKVYGGESARGGDWREGFVDKYLDLFREQDFARRMNAERERDEMGLLDRVAGAASRVLRGMFGREATPEEREGAESMRNFISEAVRTAPEEATTMREMEEFERRVGENAEEMTEGLYDSGVNRKIRLDSFDVNEAVDAAIEIEKEVIDGRRGYDIVGGGTVAGRRAVELSNLPNGRNLLVGAHVIANRFGTLEVSDPTFPAERERSADIAREIASYAKKQKAWTSSVEGSMKKMGATPFKSGSEADVWKSKSGRTVFKAITPETYYDGDMRLLLDRIAIHNYVSPDAPLRVIGFGMHKGSMNVVVSQPFFAEGEAGTLTQRGFKAAMEDLGFERVTGAHITDMSDPLEEVWVSCDRRIVLGDLAPRNVAVSGNSLRIIDMAAFRNAPWLRDRADIPEKLRPRGQKTYEQMNAAVKEREQSALREFYENMGMSPADARKRAEGLYQAVGANGLVNLCGSEEASSILGMINDRFFKVYNDAFKRAAYDSEAIRTGSDEVVRKKVTFAELNKEAGTVPVQIKTKSGVTLNAYALFGGNGYISAERWRSDEDIYSLGGASSGDAGIRFVWAGDSARLPKGLLEGMQNPKGAKWFTLKDFFFKNARTGEMVSDEAKSIFDAYPAMKELKRGWRGGEGTEVEFPALADVPVFVRGSDEYKKYRDMNKRFVSEPYFATTDNEGRNQNSPKTSMVLVDSLGSVVIHENANQKQIAAGINEAIIRNIQLRERWEKPATRSALEFFKSRLIEEPEKDAARQTQLFRLGSGRLRSLIFDIVSAHIDKVQNLGTDGAWYRQSKDEIKSRVADAITEATKNSYEYFASEVEAFALSRSFIDRKRMKAAREDAQNSNVPTDSLFVTEKMLEEIGSLREWQDRGLVDSRTSRLPTVEQSRRVLDFYKTVVTDAVAKVLNNRADKHADRQAWLTDEFGAEADKLFREYVKSHIAGREKAMETYRDSGTTRYDERGFAVRTVESDVDSIDMGGSRSDAMVNFVVELLDREGLSALSKLNDGRSETFRMFDEMAREGYLKDADETDIRNNKLSAASRALEVWKSDRRSGRQDGVYSIEEERKLRLDNRRLKGMVDRANARRLRLRAIHNAAGITRQELDARIGMDSIGSLSRLAEGKEKELADNIEVSALAYIRNHNEDLSKLPPDAFMKSPVAAAEFGATVASWLGNAARHLSFGQVRENAKRDAARIRRYTERPNIDTIRGILLQNIASISAQMRRNSVGDIIERMKKTIDKNAMGRQAVTADKELYRRKVEPRIQQYWKFVKDAMDMRQEDVDNRLDAIRQKHGDFATALADVKDGKGSEGVVPSEETLLERDLAQLEYTALMRYGALSEKHLGDVADAVDIVAADIELAQRRVELEVGPRLERFKSDIDALAKGCTDFRSGEKDGKYELGKFAKALRSAMYFNSPDLFRRLKMYFKTDSEAFRVCEELRRDISMAHIDMEATIAEFETSMRDEIPAMFESKYGKVGFEKLMALLHEKVEGYEEFSRSGWRVPTEGADYIEFDTGKTYERDVAEYTKDVVNADGRVVHKKGDTVPRTTKLDADGKLLDESGAEIGRVVHRKGDPIMKRLAKAVGPDDPRHDHSGHVTRLSLADLIYIYAARRQGDMRANNAVYGCDDEYMRRLEAAIGPEGIAVADWLVQKFDGLREKLTVVSERITGMPVLSPDVQYVPLRFEGDAAVSGSTKYRIDAFPSFLTRRQNHDTSVLREGTGVFDVFSSRVNETAHYMAFSDVIERVKATFCDRKVQNAYRELLGESAFRQMYRQLFETLSGGVREPTGWFGRLRNFTTATTLFLNVPSAIKQFEGVAAYSAPMGIGHWLGNLHHMGKAYGILSASSRLRRGEFMRALEDIGNPFETRKREGYSDIITSLKEARDKAERNGNGVASNPLTRFYMRNGLSLTSAIDSLASASMGCAFYNQKFAEHMSKGMTVEEARRAAIADLDYAIQETQQSRRREFLLGPQADSLWGRVLSQFAGPAYIRFGMEIEALHRAVYVDKNPRAWKELVNKVIALHVVCPTALSLLGLGAQSIVHRADDEEWAQRAVRDWCVAMCLGPLSGWFIGGAAVNYATQTMANGFIDEDMSVMQLRNGSPMVSKVYDLTTKTAKIAKDVIDGLREDDIDTDKIAEEVGKLVDSLLPVERIAKRAYQNLSDKD